MLSFPYRNIADQLCAGCTGLRCNFKKFRANEVKAIYQFVFGLVEKQDLLFEELQNPETNFDIATTLVYDRAGFDPTQGGYCVNTA